jgi:uncharacterized protein
MTRYRVMNLTRNTLLADRAERADTFSRRFMGLMGQTHLATGAGLHLDPCNSVHTFFMKMAIDVLFLDAEQQIVDIWHAMPPWRTSTIHFTAKSVLELPAGMAAAAKTETGDRLSFVFSEDNA